MIFFVDYNISFLPSLRNNMVFDKLLIKLSTNGHSYPRKTSQYFYKREKDLSGLSEIIVMQSVHLRDFIYLPFYLYWSAFRRVFIDSKMCSVFIIIRNVVDQNASKMTFI